MKKIIVLISIVLLAVATGFAQKMTAEELGKKADALYNAGNRREAIDLIDKYPEFAEEIGILYIKSVAYTELRDYTNADVSFQKTFDIFLKNAADAFKEAEQSSAKAPLTKLDREVAEMMFEAALTSYNTADLTNSLRRVAFAKNGMPEEKREPKNLAGFDEFRKNFESTSIKFGAFVEKQGKFAKAAEVYGKALEINTQNAAAYAARAKVYRKLRKIKAAAADEAAAKKYAVKS